MIWLRSSLFALAMALFTPPYALMLLATFPLPRMLRYRIIAGWARTMIALARAICGIRWTVEGERLRRRPGDPFQAPFGVKHGVSRCFRRRSTLKRGCSDSVLRLGPLMARSRSTVRGASALKSPKARAHRASWVVVFPEGRARAGRYGATTGGAWLGNGVRVVPVAHNAGLVWPRNAFLKRPGLVTVRVGLPIETAGRTAEAITAEAETWIETQQEELCPVRAS